MKAILQGQKVSGLPEGGTAGQVLTKIESGSSWQNVPSDIFIVQRHGDTTFQEVKEAFDEGKFILMNANWTYVPIYSTNGTSFFTFKYIANSSVYKDETLWDNDSWTESTVNFSNYIFSTTDPGQTGQGTPERVIRFYSPYDYYGKITKIYGGDEDGQSRLFWDAADYQPKLVTITLASASWFSNSQTVSVSGILADSTAQNVQVSPKTSTDADNWGEAGIWCNESTVADQLTFTCKSVPSVDIQVNISIQEAS